MATDKKISELQQTSISHPAVDWLEILRNSESYKIRSENFIIFPAPPPGAQYDFFPVSTLQNYSAYDVTQNVGAAPIWRYSTGFVSPDFVALVQASLIFVPSVTIPGELSTLLCNYGANNEPWNQHSTFFNVGAQFPAVAGVMNLIDLTTRFPLIQANDNMWVGHNFFGTPAATYQILGLFFHYTTA